MTRGYVPGIDGLRAAAVLSVVLYHVAPSWMPGGFTGVDVFFVISGFVVSKSLAGTLALSFREFITGFYARRIVRLYPALLACLIVTSLFSSLFIPKSWLSNATTKTGAAAFFGLSNFALVWFSDGYFSPRVEFNAFTHTWSLAVEEQFYLLFPLLFFRFRRLLPSLWLGSLAWAAFATAAAPDRAFYLLPSRFWELATGACLFLYLEKYPVARFRAGALWLGLALMAGGFVWTGAGTVPFPGAILPVLGTALAIYGVTAIRSRWLESRPATLVGKMSYSIYLWHWPVLVLLRWTTGVESAVTIAIALLLTAVLSALSYYYIEPVRRWPGLGKLTPGKIVWRGGLAIGVAALIGAGLLKAQERISLSKTRAMRVWHPMPWPVETEAGRIPAFRGRKLFVIGDSHVGAYSTMLEMLRARDGLEVIEYFQAGCSVVNLLETTRVGCGDFIARSVAEIEKIAQPGDAVFLASLRSERLGDQWKSFDLARAKEKNATTATSQRSAVLAEADSLLRRMDSAALTVILDAPKPVFPSPAFRCADWFNATNRCVPRDRSARSPVFFRWRSPECARQPRAVPRLSPATARALAVGPVTGHDGPAGFSLAVKKSNGLKCGRPKQLASRLLNHFRVSSPVLLTAEFPKLKLETLDFLLGIYAPARRTSFEAITGDHS